MSGREGAVEDLEDGQSVEMKGAGTTRYTLRNASGVYSCSCPAWSQQSVPADKRTCKHLKRLRGEQAERDRIGRWPPPPRSVQDSTEGTGPRMLTADDDDESVELEEEAEVDALQALALEISPLLSRVKTRLRAEFPRGLPMDVLRELGLDESEVEELGDFVASIGEVDQLFVRLVGR